MLTVLKKQARNISYNYLYHDMPFYIEFNETEPATNVKKCIEAEINLTYKKLIYMAAKGYTYDMMANELGLDAKKIRFKMFEAKDRLKKRLAKYGVNVTNEAYVNSYVTLAMKKDAIKMYNDFPYNESYSKSVCFLLSKNYDGLTFENLSLLLAKNKNLEIKSCQTYLKVCIKGLINNSDIKKVNDLYFIN